MNEKVNFVGFVVADFEIDGKRVTSRKMFVIEPLTSPGNIVASKGNMVSEYKFTDDPELLNSLQSLHSGQAIELFFNPKGRVSLVRG